MPRARSQSEESSPKSRKRSISPNKESPAKKVKKDKKPKDIEEKKVQKQKKNGEKKSSPKKYSPKKDSPKKNKKSNALKASPKKKSKKDDPSEDSDDEIFEVEQILGRQKSTTPGRKGKWEYEVKWKGYSEDDNTWELRANLAEGSPGLLKKYEDEQGIVDGRKKKREKKEEAGQRRK